MNIHERIERYEKNDYPTGDYCVNLHVDMEIIADHFTDSTPLTGEYLRQRFGEPVKLFSKTYRISEHVAIDDESDGRFTPYIHKGVMWQSIFTITTVGQLNSLLYAAGVRE